jgi:uncharacterized protein YwlG (UPF0340 family)
MKKTKTQVVREGFVLGLSHAEIVGILLREFPKTSKETASVLVSATKGYWKKKGILVEYGKKNSIPGSLVRKKHPVSSGEVSSQPLASHPGTVSEDDCLFT